MIRPLSRPQHGIRPFLAADAVAEAQPTDAALIEKVQLLERENLQLRQTVTSSQAALTSSEERVAKLDKQCLELTRVRSPREDQQAKIVELEQQVTTLSTEKANLAQQVLTLSAEPKPAASTPTVPTLITIVGISEDKKGSDGTLGAKVKLDDTEAEVFLAVNLDTARTLLRRVKEV